MIPYIEALKTILETIPVLKAEEKTLIKACGQVLAEDVYSGYDLPLRATSGPDGYAVRSSDIEKADQDHPVTLQIIARVRAGALPEKAVSPGTAIRIMTGSVVPKGADCVVRFEDTDEPGNKNGPNENEPAEVKIFISHAPGTNMNQAGANIRKGSLLMPRDTLIGPPQLSALTAVGKKSVRVIRRPKAAVITTGDELIKSGARLTPGKVYDCNGIAVRSMVDHYGGIVSMNGTARDKEESIMAKIRKGLSADMIVTTGGVSMGDYDLVRRVIGKMGQLVFSKIKMGPGAAFAFGLLRRPSSGRNRTVVPIFALSGPPSGCLINFETLVRPALFKMRGLQALDHPVVEAAFEDPIANSRIVDFVKWTELKTTGAGYSVGLNTEKGLLASFATANSLAIILSGAEVNTGDKLFVWPLDWSQK